MGAKIEVRSRHGCVLGVAVYLISFASFALLGARGVEPFKRDWLPLLFVSVVGIGGFTRLFVDVVSAQAAEAARRDAAELRAVNLLARRGARDQRALHDRGWRLAILARRLRPTARMLSGRRARWCEHRQGHRHTHEHDTQIGGSARALSPMLDIRRSALRNKVGTQDAKARVRRPGPGGGRRSRTPGSRAVLGGDQRRPDGRASDARSECVTTMRSA